MSQQRFGRDRTDANQGFTRAFPKLTAGYAARGFNGNNVKSGLAAGGINQYVGDYNQSLGRMDEDQAAYESNWQNQQSQMGNQYQASLLALQEELQRQRALQDPYATVTPYTPGA